MMAEIKEKGWGPGPGSAGRGIHPRPGGISGRGHGDGAEPATWKTQRPAGGGEPGVTRPGGGGVRTGRAGAQGRAALLACFLQWTEGGDRVCLWGARPSIVTDDLLT